MIKSEKTRLTLQSTLSEALLEKVFFTFIPKKQMPFVVLMFFFHLPFSAILRSSVHSILLCLKKIANKNIDR